MNAAIGGDELRQLFPFYLHFEPQGRVLDVGPTLGRVVPDLVGRPSSEVIASHRPPLRLGETEPAELADRLLMLTIVPRPDLVLRGQALVRGDGVLFLGSPWVTNSTDLQALDLRLSDFSHLDAVVDYLFLLQTQRRSLDEARALEARLTTSVQELDAERSRLDTTLETLRAGILLEDETRHVVLANQTLCDLFGIDAPPSALVGSDCEANLQATASLFEDPQGFIEATNERIGEGRPYQGEIFVFCDGRTVERDYAPVRHAAGTGHLWVYRDITTERTIRAELQAAMQAARQKDTSKTHFLAAMSHEIRNPLNVVVGMTDLLAGFDLPDEPARFVRALESNAQLLLSLLGGVLDVARIEAGALRLDEGPVDPIGIAEQVVDALHPRARDKGLELFVDPRGTPTVVLSDEARIRQVVANLAGNAIKFTRHGRVVIRVETVMTEPGQALLVIEVEDTGVGIPEERLGTIFDRFSQAGPEIGQEFGGTGLGLTITRALVERMGGTLEVESVLGQGSTFRIRLPASLGPSRACATELEGRTAMLLHPAGPKRDALARRLHQQGLTLVDASSHPAVAVVHPSLLGEAPPAVPRVLLVPGGGRAPDTTDPRLHEPVRCRDLHHALTRALGAESVAVTRPSRPQGLRVLVVDDEADNRTFLAHTLRRDGHEVVLANDGASALDLVAHERFDLIISDLHMPRVSGLEFARRLRKLEAERRAPRTPLIALTGHAMVGVKEQCFDAGFDEYQTKPITAALLLRCVSRVSSRARRILLVDDDGDARMLGRRLLEREGYEVREAWTLASVEREIAYPPDLVLLDLSLGDTSGWTIAYHLRRDPRTREVPIVVCSGSEDEDDLKLARELGCADVLGKPYSRERLLGAVRAALEDQAPDAEPDDGTIEVSADVAPLVPTFLASTREKVARARAALEGGDLERVRSIGHALKGTGTSYGFPRITELGARLESSEGDLADTLESLQRYLEEVRWR